MSLAPIAEWLETTPVARWVQESEYGFVIVVAAHIFGLTLSVGTVIWFDLRLLGVALVRIPASLLYRRLMPLILGGFAIMFISGGVLLAAYATAAYGNLYFRIKLLALVVAGINAAVYHRFTERQSRQWDDTQRPPWPARTAGLVSILVWMTALVAGRMMSYTMFWVRRRSRACWAQPTAGAAISYACLAAP